MPPTTVQRFSKRLSSEDAARLEACFAGIQADTPELSAFVEQLRQQVQAAREGRNLLVLDSDQELTSTQAAEALGFSRPHLIKLSERGDLPFRKVGRDRRYKARDLAEWIARQERNREFAQSLYADADERRNQKVAARAGMTRDRAHELGLH